MRGEASTRGGRTSNIHSLTSIPVLSGLVGPLAVWSILVASGARGVLMCSNPGSQHLVRYARFSR
jgi:hypothetical protein